MTTKRTRLPIALIVIALVIGIPVGIKCGVSLRGLFGVGSPISTPSTHNVKLNHGSYSLYALTGSQSQVGPVTYTSNQAPAVSPSDIEVTGPTGDRIAVAPSTPNATIQRNSKIYTRFANLRAPTDGSYEVKANTKDHNVILLAPTFSQAFGAIMNWFVIAVLSWLMFLFGIGMLIYRAIKRHSAS